MVIIREENALDPSKCSFCSNSAIIHRRHSGQSLCSDCFIKSIEKIFRKTISRYDMITPGCKITVAVSGGKDSMVLLHNLIRFQEKKHKKNEIVVLSVDEGIQNYRSKGIDIVKKFCEKNGLEHQILSFKKEAGFSLDEIVENKNKLTHDLYACNYCAIVRRRLLNESAKKNGAEILALGHNLTDFAETFLMNILHNRLNLIANQHLIKPSQAEALDYYVKKISPLMKIPEEEILIYAKQVNFDFHDEHCPYRLSDPILRKRVLRFIEKCKLNSPEIEFNLFNAFSAISEVLFDSKEKKSYKNCKFCGYPTFNSTICRYCQLIKDLKKDI